MFSRITDMSRLILKDSGNAARVTKRLFVRDATASRNIKRLFVVDAGGVSRLVFSPGEVELDNAATSDTNPGGLVRAGFRFNSDGTITAIGDTAPTGLKWFSNAPVSGIGANYQIRRTDAGNYDTNAANQNVWIDLSASREWSITAVGAASPTNEGENLVIEIREGSSGAAEDSAIFSMNISN